MVSRPVLYLEDLGSRKISVYLDGRRIDTITRDDEGRAWIEIDSVIKHDALVEITARR